MSSDCGFDLLFISQDFDISLLEQSILRGIEGTLLLSARRQNPEVMNLRALFQLAVFVLLYWHWNDHGNESHFAEIWMNYFPAEGQVSRELSPSITTTLRIEAVEEELPMSLPQRRALHAASAKGGKKCSNHELLYPFLVAFLKLASTRTRMQK